MADSQELISFIAQMTGESNLRVEENLGEGYVRLRVSEAERRQAKHDIQHVEDMVIELLRNARDAGAQHIYVATYRDDDLRKVVVIDDGCGVPEDMQDRIFEARVTSKLESMHMDRWGVHGRGMALFSIKENCEEARVVASGAGKGTVISVVADTERTSCAPWQSSPWRSCTAARSISVPQRRSPRRSISTRTVPSMRPSSSFWIPRSSSPSSIASDMPLMPRTSCVSPAASASLCQSARRTASSPARSSP